MFTETDLDESVDTFNSLLRGELAAIEGYENALSRFEGQTEEAPLSIFCDEHREAAILIRERVIDLGGEPFVGPGAWGVSAAAITGAASVMGGSVALSALRRGEEHAARTFEEAVVGEVVSDECHALIAGYLLPHARRRIESLGRLIDSSR